eukprot:9111262-Pyramimonas_sp.AAC.1
MDVLATTAKGVGCSLCSEAPALACPRPRRSSVLWDARTRRGAHICMPHGKGKARRCYVV